MPYGYIYKIENIVNGKVYIGQSVNVYKRFEGHKYDSQMLNISHIYHVLEEHVDNHIARLVDFIGNLLKMFSRTYSLVLCESISSSLENGMGFANPYEQNAYNGGNKPIIYGSPVALSKVLPDGAQGFRMQTPADKMALDIIYD